MIPPMICIQCGKEIEDGRQAAIWDVEPTEKRIRTRFMCRDHVKNWPEQLLDKTGPLREELKLLLNQIDIEFPPDR
jgi:hypothetical protein